MEDPLQTSFAEWATIYKNWDDDMNDDSIACTTVYAIPIIWLCTVMYR